MTSPAFHEGTAWLVIARAEMGVCVHQVGSSHPRIGEYHEHAGISGYDDKVSWGSSFINWSLSQVGITGTRSALARSWLRGASSGNKSVSNSGKETVRLSGPFFVSIWRPILRAIRVGIDLGRVVSPTIWEDEITSPL